VQQQLLAADRAADTGEGEERALGKLRCHMESSRHVTGAT
jgi:hypothetical protein